MCPLRAGVDMRQERMMMARSRYVELVRQA